MKVYTYHSSGGRDLIEKFIEKLPRKEQPYARETLKIIKDCESHKEMQERLDIKHWDDGIYEVRFRKNNRYFYVYFEGNTVYILHGLQKKSQQTPKSDSDIVRSRANEIKNNK